MSSPTNTLARRDLGGGGGSPSYLVPTVSSGQRWQQGYKMTSSSQTNPNALRSVGMAHVSAWGLPCRGQSPVLPQTYSHRERMTPAGQWGIQITIAVQLRTALCGLIIHRVPCSARTSVGGGRSPSGRSSRISCVNSYRKLLIKNSPNQKLIPQRREDSQNVCSYTHLGGLRHRFAWICPPYLLG